MPTRMDQAGAANDDDEAMPATLSQPPSLSTVKTSERLALSATKPQSVAFTSMRERMARVRTLAHLARDERDATKADMLLDEARRHFLHVQRSFDANPSNERASLAPLVRVTRDAIDEIATLLNEVTVAVVRLRAADSR